MFDISEAGAPTYNWANKVKGWDFTDPVEGGTNGADNVPLKQLAERTRNLHDRLATIEPAFVGYNPANAINAQLLTLGGMIAAKADKTAANLNGTNVTQWLAKLGITNMVVRSGVASFNSISSATVNDYTIVLPSSLPNYDPATHTIFLTIERNVGTPIVIGFAFIKSMPGLGTLNSFVASFYNTSGSTVIGTGVIKFHYSIIKQL